MIAAYERHNADVKRIVAPECLLVYEMRVGRPCARSLAQIPKVNTTEEFRDRILKVYTRPGV
jgi:hypothetical protein